MKFLIVTHVQHKMDGENIYGYGPYIKEMNLWLKFVEKVMIVAPMTDKNIDPIDLAYKNKKLIFLNVPIFNLTTLLEKSKTFFKLPILITRIFRGMLWADHIHIRCPGNMGLLAVLVQICFPYKSKTAKYAGNWDPKSNQPWSYRAQKWILSSTFLTKNMKVLVYGEWLEQSKNILPFFTASYSTMDISTNEVKRESPMIKLLFVGALTKNKRPLLSIHTAHRLVCDGFDVKLDLFGEGLERSVLESYIKQHGLEDYIILHGNKSSEVVKHYYKKADFLIFISKSEGWPKVVAEAMFWGCIPLTSDVSCVNYMIGDGSRGKIVEPHVNDIVKKIKYYIGDTIVLERSRRDAMSWSQQFTLEKFEEKIGEILYEY